MRDQAVIYAGLVLFLGLATSPFLAHLIPEKTPGDLQLSLPKEAKECVAPVDFMKRYHMRLLLDWRDGVVRRNQRTYVSPGGQVYAASLSATCLGKCHTDKAQFCDRCHSYLGVHGPDCMDCHVDPRSARKSDE